MLATCRSRALSSLFMQASDMSGYAYLRDRAEEFDTILTNAVRASAYPPHADRIVALDSVLKWKLAEFFDNYIRAAAYSLERLPAVMDRLMDTKLQFYFAARTWPGTMNVMVYS